MRARSRTGEGSMTEGQPQQPPSRWGLRAAVGFVFVAVMMDMTALGIVVPVLPGLVRQLLHGDAALAARYIGWFATVWALMQFFSSPVAGALSDRFGRRPVLLASMFGMAADYVVMALAPTVGWLLLGRIISGVTSASFSTANAYIADVTPPEKRAARFGLLGAAFGIGFIGGPAIGGLLGQYDPRAPFWCAAVLCFCNGLYGVFVVPESLAPENRSPFSLRLANPVGAFELYSSGRDLLILAAIMFLFYLSHQVLQSTWVLYTAYRYHWSTRAMGLSLMLVGVGSIVVQALVVRRFVARFGERSALYCGLFAGVAGFLIYGLARVGQEFLLGVPVFAILGLLAPGVQGLMSRRIPANQQGRLQGANSSLMAIASMLGPILFTETFARTITRWSAWAPLGTPFFLAAALLSVALALSFTVGRTGRGAAPAE
ncbi:MAG: TCR/Tet family MFS transporter [Caulobacteraceae bacterium]|nr:TCR/Tet family MFS transporter [Caulobacteraceae bacterium]